MPLHSLHLFVGRILLIMTSSLLLMSNHGRSHIMSRRTPLNAFSSLFFASSANALSATSLGTAASFLKDPSLLHWETTPSTSSREDNPSFFQVTDPASPDTILAEVPSMDAREAIIRSHEALPAWRDDTTAGFRASLLQEWSRLITQHADDLAKIMTLESGKPLAESTGEVNYGKSFLDYYAAEAIRPTGAGGGFVTPSAFSSPEGSPRGQTLAIQQAVGVTAMITPWNFPMAMITRKVGPALAAGCTAVVKPSELTPLSAMALKNLADRAGIPQGVFQVVMAPPGAPTALVGTEFCTHPFVRKISFTGSTNVGKLLMKQSSDTVKRMSLELGGNAPFVIFDDVADLDQAVNAAMTSKFRNAGQTCVCADRFLVQAGIHDEFVKRLVAKVESELRVGPGIDPNTTMGPLITTNAVESVTQKVNEAIAEGAKCWTGNGDDAASSSSSLGPHFMAPVVLTDVDRESTIWKTETFGPVAPIMSFDTEEDALEIANDSSVGLASYFCTSDLSRAFRFAQKLECGIVGVNDGIISNAAAPFGGVKESGLGREGSALGLSEYLETKYIFMNT